MRKIVTETIIDSCCKCDACILQEMSEGDAGEMGVYCTKLKDEYGMPKMMAVITDQNGIGIPEECPYEK